MSVLVVTKQVTGCIFLFNGNPVTIHDMRASEGVRDEGVVSWEGGGFWGARKQT